MTARVKCRLLRYTETETFADDVDECKLQRLAWAIFKMDLYGSRCQVRNHTSADILTLRRDTVFFSRNSGLPVVFRRHVLVQGRLLPANSVEVLTISTPLNLVAVPEDAPSFELREQKVNNVLERGREQRICLRRSLC